METEKIETKLCVKNCLIAKIDSTNLIFLREDISRVFFKEDIVNDKIKSKSFLMLDNLDLEYANLENSKTYRFGILFKKFEDPIVLFFKDIFILNKEIFVYPTTHKNNEKLKGLTFYNNELVAYYEVDKIVAIANKKIADYKLKKEILAQGRLVAENLSKEPNPEQNMEAIAMFLKLNEEEEEIVFEEINYKTVNINTINDNNLKNIVKNEKNTKEKDKGDDSNPKDSEKVETKLGTDEIIELEKNKDGLDNILVDEKKEEKKITSKNQSELTKNSKKKKKKVQEK